ncbi:prepilin peptidase [Amycolatopsis solani]|uniref:prepilin peptidase n=1 Tax=Amycolatopsis solani TaxID=3028615 RepID=UPI0025B26D14|nr:A24 family peptidase [Amycolatopsis sp. MEP2-6]
MAVLVVAAAVLGLFVGSFLNLVVQRVPRGEPVVRPPFRCPVSARHFLVALGTAVLFALLTLRLDPPHLPAYLYFGAIGVALALIDFDCRRLPDAIVLPSYPVLAVLLAVSAWCRDDWWSLARAGIGGTALFAFYLLLALIHPRGMGFGDVKLSGLLGGLLAHLSWTALLLGAFGGFLLGAVAGVVVLAAGRGDRDTALPFGPFMIAAALVAVFVVAA